MGDSLRIVLGDRVLFDELSFAWDGPGVVAVTGPSGSGKSTLLSVLMGWTAPDLGSIEMKPCGATVWLVPQNAPLLDSRTVRANLDVARLAAASDPGADGDGEEAIDEVLARFALAHRARTRACHLSGGERQRVALARAALRRPDVILADEVTAGLDPISVRGVIGSLRTLADEGALVVTATHDERVWSLADVVLDLGSVGR